MPKGDRYDPAPSVSVTLQTNQASGITFDSAGKLWIADSGGVKKYDPPTADGKPTPLLFLDLPSPHFENASATAFDKLGNLWVHDLNGIYEFTVAQITTPKTTLEIVPDQTFTYVLGKNYALRFYPVPDNLPLYH